LPASHWSSSAQSRCSGPSCCSRISRIRCHLSRVNPLGRFATTKLAGECPQVVAGDNLGAATRKLSYPAARSLISTGFS
jgi:hypothetical protein